MTRLVLCLAVVLGLVGCSTNGDPPKLPVEPTGTLGNYVLADGVHTTVDHATAYRFGHATIADADRVASAFKVNAAAKPDKYGWSFGPYDKTVDGVQPPSAYVSVNGRFRVDNGGGVSYTGPACPNPNGDGVIACGSSPTTLSTRVPAHFTNADVQETALQALAAAGAGLPHPRVTVPYADGYFYEVAVGGRVGGKKADGYEARVEVNQDKTITDATGFVTHVTPAGSYKLVSLRRAVERLNAGYGVISCGRGMVGPPGIVINCGEEPAGRPAAVTTLTGVTVGLTVVDGADSLWLVPAYVFTTADHRTVVTAAAA